MWGLLWRGIAGLIAILSGLIGVIRAQPYDDNGVRGVLAETQACPVACIMGLQPGQTTFDEALSRLNANDWVNDVKLVHGDKLEDGKLEWTWSGQQHALINAQQPGTALIRAGIITYVTLPTEAEFWQFLLLNGQPDASHFFLIRSQTRHEVYHRARYNSDNLTLLVDTVSCPLSPTALYESSIALETYTDASILIPSQPDFHYGETHLLSRELGC